MASKEFSKKSEQKLSIEEKTAIQLEKLRQHSSLKILIDGLAGVGKGTLVGKLAKDLNLKQIKTGDMYRAITWYLLESGFDFTEIENMSEEELQQLLANFEIEFKNEDSSWWVNHPNVAEKINLTVKHLRSPEVDRIVSQVAFKLSVRDVVDTNLKEIVETNDKVVSEGRDMYQVFSEERTDLTMLYMYASETDLLKRQKGRQFDTTGEEISFYEAASVLRRNNSDNQKERGKLLLPGELHLGNYDLIINNSGLEIAETYLLVLESLNTLDEVRAKIEEVNLIWIEVSKKIEELTEEETTAIKDSLIFVASQWDGILDLMDLYEREGNKEFGKILLEKLNLYQQSLLVF